MPLKGLVLIRPSDSINLCGLFKKRGCRLRLFGVLNKQQLLEGDYENAFQTMGRDNGPRAAGSHCVARTLLARRPQIRVAPGGDLARSDAAVMLTVLAFMNSPCNRPPELIPTP